MRSPSYAAAYGYRYGSCLASVSSNFPNEGTVTYTYGADGLRRARTVAGVSTKYNWQGYAVTGLEDSNGVLTETRIGTAADVAGSDPASGTYRYHGRDHLGSASTLRAQDRTALGAYESDPYGGVYSESGAAVEYNIESNKLQPQ